MKFMINVVISNAENQELISKLEKIVNNDKLSLENILSTVNQKKYYDQLLFTLKYLSNNSKTFKLLYKRVLKNPQTLKTKSNSVLENLQKAMLLSFFNDLELKHELIMEMPLAIVLDNYSVHHALPFVLLCNFLNINLIYLPPYSPKYNPIEQVWRVIKSTLSRKYITSKVELKYLFEKEYYKVVGNSSFWDGWAKNFIWDYQL